MINLLVGLQGSGKTYYAVAEIWKHIKKMHAAEISGTTYKYQKIYTNIEGMIPNRYVENLDVSKLLKLWEWELRQYKNYEDRHAYMAPDDIEFSPSVRKNKRDISALFDMDVEEQRVETSSVDDIEIFENNDQKLLASIKDTDTDLDPEFVKYTLPYFEEAGFSHCLIVIDEAHNYFGGSLKPAFRRLISYHRHYHDQDFLLISQDTSMFNSQVTRLTSYTISAVNSIMRYRPDIFSYNVYSGGWISFNGDNKLETKNLKAKELIFSLYNSGGKELAKSYFAKIILKIGGMVAAVFVFGYFAIANFSHADPIRVVDNKEKNETIPTPPHPQAAPVTVQQKKKAGVSRSYESFLIVGGKMIHDRTGKKIRFTTFEAIITDQDRPESVEKNLDGTARVHYSLTDRTLENLGIPNEKDHSSSHGFNLTE